MLLACVDFGFGRASGLEQLQAVQPGPPLLSARPRPRFCDLLQRNAKFAVREVIQIDRHLRHILEPTNPMPYSAQPRRQPGRLAEAGIGLEKTTCRLCSRQELHRHAERLIEEMLSSRATLRQSGENEGESFPGAG